MKLRPCACGAEPKYVTTRGFRVYAQVVCPHCGAKGIKQASDDTIKNAKIYAINCWNSGQMEVKKIESLA